ncbi:MAG: hypothetical protein HY434_00965 [Candidatus Liptonbacteria bacterium]|nr:hypothetical protein [Candidatus Liptonbacteria bacterium]
MKNVVLAVLVFFVSILSASAQMPDYRHWPDIRGYAGPHKVDGRTQKFYYVAKTSDGKEKNLTTFYFAKGSEEVRVVFNAQGTDQGQFATHFYPGGHEFYVREHSFADWRKVSWTDAQRFLRKNNVWLKKYEPK